MEFYLDENLPPRVANALHALEQGEGISVYHTKVAFNMGILDPDLYPKLKERNGILITNDFKMLSRKAEYQLMISLGITAFFIKFPSGANFFVKYKMIFDRWEEIKKICKENKRPFKCKIKPRGKSEIW